MAKKKTDESEDKKQLSAAEASIRIFNEINKQYGEGICVPACDIANRDLKVIPWSASLDLILGGGVPEGSWISVAGMPKLGKSSSLLKLAVNMQKAGKMCYYLNVEGRAKKKDLVYIKDLDLSKEKFLFVTSTPDKILSSQDYLHIAENILKTHLGCFLIIDSISALADEKQLNEGFETEMRGKDYQTIGRFINNLGQFVSASKSIVAGVVHKIANTSGMGASSQDRVCNRFKFQSDIRLDAKYMEKWKVGEEIIGQIIHWSCTSSALGRPYLETSSYLRYGVGLDDVYETMKFGEACGLIGKAGAWYTLDFLGEGENVQKLQGSENVYKYLNENPHHFDILSKEVKQFSNTLVKNSDD